MSAQPQPAEPLPELPQQPAEPLPDPTQVRIEDNQKLLRQLLKVLPIYLRMHDASSVNLEKPNTAGEVSYQFILRKRREGHRILYKCSTRKGTEAKYPSLDDTEEDNTGKRVIKDLKTLAERLGGSPAAKISGGYDDPLGSGNAVGSDAHVTLTIDLTNAQLTTKLDEAHAKYQQEKSDRHSSITSPSYPGTTPGGNSPASVS